jgi:hypothetical protein
MVRPNVDINFTDGFPDPIKKHIQNEYVLPGRLISKDVDFSDDNLTKTITRVFKSQEDFNTWTNDPLVALHRAKRNVQAANTGIVITQTTELI